MKQFSVVVLDPHGRRRVHTMTAPTEAAVRRTADQRGWRLLSVAEAKPSVSLLLNRRHLPCQILSFLFYQLGAMTQAGISLVQAWRLLLHDIPQTKRRSMLHHVANAMEHGLPFADALAQSRLFPAFACHMIRSGEQTGNLDTICRLLGAYYDYAGKQRSMLRNALAYPVFLLCCTCAMMGGAAFFILPVFEDMFRQMDIPMPAATQYMLSIVHGIRRHSIPLAGILLAVLSAGAAVLRRPDWRLAWERNVFTVSWLRTWCLMVCWQRFGQILSVQVGSGIPLLQALENSAAVAPSCWFRQEVREAAQRLERGISFSQAVRQGNLGTPYVETMLVVGETTGQYEDILRSIADYYGWQLQNRLFRIQRLLGPVVLLVIGAFMGALVLCLLLPLLDMATGITV